MPCVCCQQTARKEGTAERAYRISAQDGTSPVRAVVDVAGVGRKVLLGVAGKTLAGSDTLVEALPARGESEGGGSGESLDEEGGGEHGGLGRRLGGRAVRVKRPWLLVVRTETHVLYRDIALREAERAYRSQHGVVASQRSEHMPSGALWLRARHCFGRRRRARDGPAGLQPEPPHMYDCDQCCCPPRCPHRRSILRGAARAGGSRGRLAYRNIARAISRGKSPDFRIATWASSARSTYMTRSVQDHMQSPSIFF